MAKDYKRNTAFLYPDLAGCSPDERKEILDLVADIRAIVKMANRRFRRLIDDGNFSFINCMPKVYMRCVNDRTAALQDMDNIRICIISLDGHDYSGSYSSIVKKYKAGQTDISHLVAIDLSHSQRKTQFLADEDNRFNAVIRTDMDSLEKILVAIMFDISLYHYFLLSDSLSDRKNFNAIKYGYVSESYSSGKQEEYYGVMLSSDKPIYLPISFPQIKETNRWDQAERRQEAVAELKRQFSTFLARSMSLKIKMDRHGRILDSSDNLPRDISKDTEQIVMENRNSNEFVIVFLCDSARHMEHFVIDCVEDGMVPCWVSKDCEGKSFERSILVQREG